MKKIILFLLLSMTMVTTYSSCTKEQNMFLSFPEKFVRYDNVFDKDNYDVIYNSIKSEFVDFPDKSRGTIRYEDNTDTYSLSIRLKYKKIKIVYRAENEDSDGAAIRMRIEQIKEQIDNL